MLVKRREKIFFDQTVEEEAERNKERDRLVKKLPKEDQVFAGRMWKDIDSAGRMNMAASDLRHQLAGGAVGSAVGKLVAKKAKKSKIGGAIVGGLTGAEIAGHVGRKRSERRAERTWDAGDKKLLEFIKSDKKKREEFKKNYKPGDTLHYEYGDDTVKIMKSK